MLFIAGGFYYMNKADPDCGTTFSWTTKAFGPWAGWLGGWAALIAQIIVIANLSQIAGEYSFLLVGADSLAASTFWVTLVGVIWIIVMSWICYVGIEASAKSQYFLLGAEILTLFLFAVVALWKVYTSDPENSLHPSLSWLNPFNIPSTSALVAGVLASIFIYWGWDSTVSVNEETEDSTRTPGLAAILSTIILVGIYVVVAIAAVSFHGTQFLEDNQIDVLAALGGDVFGSPLDKLLIIAVLTSASASTQTTILPSTRTALSMAVQGAFPKRFASVHPKHMTPGVATIWMAVLSIIWYVGLTLVSQNALYDSILSIGIFILLYYGMTGLACVVYFRRELTKSVKNFVLVGRRSADRRDRDDVHPRQVDHRPLEARELGVRRVVARARPTTRHRNRIHDPGGAPDDLALVQPSRVLPTEARGRRPGGARCLRPWCSATTTRRRRTRRSRRRSAARRCSAPTSASCSATT